MRSILDKSHGRLLQEAVTRQRPKKGGEIFKDQREESFRKGK